MIWIPAFHEGDYNIDYPSRLFLPHDYTGRKCGSGALAGSPVAYWPYVHKKEGILQTATQIREHKSFKLCIQNCESKNLKNYGGYCLPKIQNAVIKKGESYQKTKKLFHEAQSVTGCGMRDLLIAKKVIAGSVGITLAVIVVWMILMKLLITPLVYCCILCIIAALGALAIALGKRSQYLAVKCTYPHTFLHVFMLLNGSYRHTIWRQKIGEISFDFARLPLELST